MVDVGSKSATARSARAVARVVFPPGILQKILDGVSKKGDVLAAVRIAGIQGAKRTSELIPLCHPVAMTHAAIECVPAPPDALDIYCTAQTVANTGVEMEAMTGVSIAALTLYDMCKSLSKGIRIVEVHLLEKTGGKSGDWNAAGGASPGTRP